MKGNVNKDTFLAVLCSIWTHPVSWSFLILFKIKSLISTRGQCFTRKVIHLFRYKQRNAQYLLNVCGLHILTL